MSFSRVRRKSYWISLPGLVDRRVLDRAFESMAALDGDYEVVLGFGSTVHIDFRALRAFARRLQGLDQVRRPVLLADLSPYCQLIFEFALSSRDWEEFSELRPRSEGNGSSIDPPIAPSRFRSHSVGLRLFDPLADHWAPHPN